MRKYYPGITLFKLVGSLLVLIAHIMLLHYMTLLPGQQLVQFTSLALRNVVPCFYVVAGFLAYKGWTHAARPAAYMKRYISRILLIYCFFCLIFVGESIVPMLISNGLGFGNVFLQIKIMIAAVFLTGPFIQFWFIPPLIFGMLAAYWLVQKQQIRLAFIMALSGFVSIQFVSGSLMNVSGINAESFPFLDAAYVEYLFLFTTRYIGFGLTFVIAGVLLAKYEDVFLQIRAIPFLIATVLFSLAETLLLIRFSEWSTDYKLAFSVLPNTLLLFYGVLRIRSNAIQTYHKFISRFSLVTFFGHILFIQMNRYMLGWTSPELNMTQNFVLLFITLIQCIAFTALFSLRFKYFKTRQTKNISS